jgi:predicted alpha/beta superfamily hydrolase
MVIPGKPANRRFELSSETVGLAVTLPETIQRTLKSTKEGREYRIFIAKPREAAPAGGYPVLYVLDANASFGTVVEAVRLQTRKPHGYDPVLVVGIGYHTTEVLDKAWFYDFTPPTPVSALPPRPDGSEWPDTGGCESFISFIEEDLKPLVELQFQIDRNRQSLFGHSLGGLFALHVLFTRPEAFQTYIAGSPSIWWNNRFVVEEEARFVKHVGRSGEEEPDGDNRSGTQADMHAVPTDKRKVNLLLAVGELERSHPSRMYDNAKEMADRLSEWNEEGLRVEFHEFIGEGHVSVLPGLVSRALKFALGKH